MTDTPALDTPVLDSPALDSPALAPVLAEHIAAVNAFDEDAIVATFADDAMVNDAHREFWGSGAIRRWVARELVGDRVTVAVAEVLDRYFGGETDSATEQRI